jgi:hypothetical protein
MVLVVCSLTQPKHDLYLGTLFTKTSGHVTLLSQHHLIENLAEIQTCACLLFLFQC